MKKFVLKIFYWIKNKLSIKYSYFKLAIDIGKIINNELKNNNDKISFNNELKNSRNVTITDCVSNKLHEYEFHSIIKAANWNEFNYDFIYEDLRLNKRHPEYVEFVGFLKQAFLSLRKVFNIDEKYTIYVTYIDFEKVGSVIKTFKIYYCVNNKETAKNETEIKTNPNRYYKKIKYFNELDYNFTKE